MKSLIPYSSHFMRRLIPVFAAFTVGYLLGVQRKLEVPEECPKTYVPEHPVCQGCVNTVLEGLCTDDQNTFGWGL